VQVYEHKNWSLAEDHIHFTIGRQASNLKQISEATKAFASLLTPASRQSAAQQAAFIREYLTTQQVCGTVCISNNGSRVCVAVPWGPADWEFLSFP
jgi:hypothetical protein